MTNPTAAEVRALRYRRKLTDLLAAANAALTTCDTRALVAEVETVSTQLEVEERFFGAPTNITREQLVTFIKQLAGSAKGWNDAKEDGDRGRGTEPLVIVLREDGSGVVASDIYDDLWNVMNVQHSFADPDEAADYLIRMHRALETVN